VLFKFPLLRDGYLKKKKNISKKDWQMMFRGWYDFWLWSAFWSVVMVYTNCSAAFVTSLVFKKTRVRVMWWLL
jgi:hypothetical protein